MLNNNRNIEIEKICDISIVFMFALSLRIINLERFPRWYFDKGTGIQ